VANVGDSLRRLYCLQHRIYNLLAFTRGQAHRIRRALRRDSGSVERLERLTVKMAVFSVLFVLAAAARVACALYERRAAPAWQRRARVTPCAPSDGPDRCPLDESIAPLEVHLVKTVAALVPGLATTVWIWSVKTATAWRRRLCACCGRSADPAVDRRGSTGRQSGGGGAAHAAATGGRLVRWSAGLKDSAPCSAASMATRAYNHCYSVS